MHPRLNLLEGYIPGGGCVIGEGRKAAVVRGTQLLNGQNGCRFKDPIANLLRRLDNWIDGINDSNENEVFGRCKLADQAQNALPIRLTRHLKIEAPDVHLKQVGQKPRIVHVGAVGGIAIATRADMHADLLALFRRKTREHLVVEFDKAAKQSAGGIEFEGETAFGEVNLDGGRSGIEGSSYIGFSFVNQV